VHNACAEEPFLDDPSTAVSQRPWLCWFRFSGTTT
jgi:hypothetical protein